MEVHRGAVYLKGPNAILPQILQRYRLQRVEINRAVKDICTNCDLQKREDCHCICDIRNRIAYSLLIYSFLSGRELDY